MEATKFLSSTLTLHRPQVFSSLSTCQKTPGKVPFIISMAASRSSRSSKRYGGDHHYGGRLVDENMIVLRMRIREMKLLEMRNEPPSNWMEWEKKYYANNGYDEDVLEAVGFLQNNLMNMRPGLALGLIALVTLSLVMSTGVVLFHAFQLAHTVILSGFYFG
ncbi:hypothetical protein EZV62_004926 [Acer yangbiense]|uniref:Uncharacterized protein n=1 Tax=Acer yangbiense TaxID=1000413 RepID=A0A5C7GND0_9ROSI|nr:hypothetical protein EZV62_028206 [Acer yangbiense]TXG69991.1 hypothetical protein EZV62_004926 [Acer yangbiense]